MDETICIMNPPTYNVFEIGCTNIRVRDVQCAKFNRKLSLTEYIRSRERHGFSSPIIP